MAQIETWVSGDLKKPVKVQYLNGNIFSQDNQGNLIGVEVFDNGEQATLSGSVSANVIRADGSTVAISGGTRSGNRCSVVLPQAAYAVPGVVSIIIKLTDSGVVTTLAAVVATVYRSTTDVIVDPGTIIPSIETLISQIQTAVASIPADYSTLWTTLAPAYSTSGTYAIGQYVTYDGGLYRCTTEITTGEAWTAAHWTAVKIGTELSDLKSAINAEQFRTNILGWEYGTFESIDGTNYETTARIRNQTLVGLSTGTERIACDTGYLFLLFAWDASGNYVGSMKTGYVIDKTTANFMYLSEFDCGRFPTYKFKVSIKKDPEASISPEDGAHCYFYKMTDKTLTLENKAADAKAVSDSIAKNLYYVSGVLPITLVPGYYTLNGSTVGQKNAPLYDGNYCCKVSCSPGDQFIVNGTGGESVRLWAFTDSSGNILSVAQSNAVMKYAVVTAPENASYFYSNTNPSYYSDYFVAKGSNVYSENLIDLNSLMYGENLIANGYRLFNAAYIQTTDGATISSSTWVCTDYIDVSKYSKLYINTSNVFSAVSAGLAFYDEKQQFISDSGIDYNVDSAWSADYPTMTEMEVAVPSGAKYVRASCRITNRESFYILSKKEEPKIDSTPPTPVIFFTNAPTAPSGTGIENQVIIDKFIDCEDVSICTRVDISSTGIVFLGAVDYLGAQHGSHVQYDFGEKEIRIYAKGTGTAVPETIIHTVDVSSLGDLDKVNLKIGRKNRQLWVGIEDYWTGNEITYTVDETALNNYDYPAGWLEDRFTYGIISGTANFQRITISTKVSPIIAFVGDSITEGYGIAYQDSWAYKAGSNFESFLAMGRSGGTIVTAQRQVDDIISKIKPKYVCVCIGTNGGNTASLLRKLCDSIKKYGCFPILCRIPMMKNASTTNERNTMISALGENTVGFDFATSIDHLNTAINLDLYQSDKIHPNVSGAATLAQRFMADMGWINFHDVT